MADNTTNNSKKNNKILSIIRVAVYTLAAMTVLFIIAGVLSKYVFKEAGTSAFGAAEFYFESDYLSEEGEIYDLKLGTTEVSFELKNFPDELRYASADIDYTVTVAVSDPKAATPVISSANGTLEGGKQSTEVITISNLKNAVTYDVTVLGKAGFEKTIKATFNIIADSSGMYKWVDDEAEYVNLTVWVDGNTNGEQLEITFPDTLVPDNTDIVMRSTKVGDTIVDQESFKKRGNITYGSYTYRFFKTDFSKKYTAENFTVKLDVNGSSSRTIISTIKKPE